MTEFESTTFIGDALAATARGLGPFITSRFREITPQLSDWTAILAQKDRQAGRRVERYNARDLSLMLRALTESLGSLGYPFNGLIDRQANTCASELRGVRNKWAHSEEFTAAETFRALDSAEILLRAVGAASEADLVAARKGQVIGYMGAPAPTAVGAEPTTADIPEPPSQVPSPPSQVPSPPSQVRSQAIAGTTAIAVTAINTLSYALARNSTPVVTEIVIEHRGAELRAASVEVKIENQLGALGEPRVAIVDLDGKSKTVLRNTDLLLDPARMLVVESPMSGTVVVTLRDAAGTEIGRDSTEVGVLAANQWIARPQPLSFELLASYVQPQATAIPPLLVEASDLLRARTGSSDLDGYQQRSPERVDAIAEAIFDAMRAHDIRYSEPPASWGLRGQKVRTPAEVLEGRLGTCMDTTLTLAAALEEAGINSTLWLMEGHIFLGYWRHDASLDAPAQVDASEALNYVGLGRIAVLETTMITGGTDSRSFTEARRAPHTAGHLQNPDRIIAITDIRQARNAGIYPLPSRAMSDTGDVVVHEYRVSAAPEALSYNPTPVEIAGSTARRLPTRVEKWKNTLLDLSLRNRLINYTAASGYSLAVPQPTLATFEDMINNGTEVALIPSDRLSSIDRSRGVQYGRDLAETTRAELLTARKSVFIDVTEGAYATRLQALRYKARTIAEETGANNLYLAFGMLRWRFNDRELRSPLVLVPVTLEASSRGSDFRLRLDEAGESTPNYCLLEKLRVSFGLEIPGLANPAKDDSGINLPATLAATREALADARLGFTVEDTADLSILQFGKFRLWKDLDESWESFTGNSLVHHLVHTPNELFADPIVAPADVDLDALGASLPVPADSSQLDAVAEAVADRTFVLEGPPGTGKSQTITNLLAHAVVSGKRVLFVAEKRAALDVVKDRLDAVGLGPFSLDLHDKGARPNAVRAQIQAGLDAVARPDGAALRAQSESAASSRGSLRRYAERLHERNAAGLSFYSARDRLLAFSPDIPSLPIPASVVAAMPEDQLDQLRTALRRLPASADLARPSELNPWGFVEANAQHPSDLGAVHAAARSFDAALSQAVSQGAGMTTLSQAQSADFIDRWAQLAGAPRYSADVLDQVHSRSLRGETRALLEQIRTTSAAMPPWTSYVTPECLDADPVAIHVAALAADESGFFGRRKRQRAVLAHFGSALRVSPKELPARSVSTITGQIAATAQAVTALRGAIASLPIHAVAPNWNPFLGDQALRATSTLEWAIWLADVLTPRNSDDADTHTLRDAYLNGNAGSGLPAALTALATAWRALEAAASGETTNGSTLARWASPRTVVDAWGTTRSPRALDTATPTSLARWVAFVRDLEPLRAHGLDEARQELISGRVPADVASLAFDKGTAATSLSERESASALEYFDADAHGKTIQRFTSSTSAIRAELPRWLPAEILARRRISVDYAGGRLGELKRQLGRQRGGMTVRALFENYADLITEIAPCVLMSPESVARFFPPKADLFDIVVFDEASQIRVADAIGAMGRAKSVVVVGDSKQMPPSSFAEVSVESEADAEVSADAVQDEESILTECVQAQVPQRWLSWHYRSQDEALISFSNHKYYENRLASFPAPWSLTPTALDGHDHGISLVRVEGHFNRTGRGKELRTNEVEARAIVDEVARRFSAHNDATPSLGIITFNAPQRTYIEALLRAEPNERIAAALDQRDGLFVKNLENVQGDERDTILFSVAFSANERGALPLNFGPLSRAGGERRLNVAITRARRQVILFASFDPVELRADQTSAVGIKHLRSYLELAAVGVEAVADDMPRSRVTDRHRDEIAEALRSRGHVVQTDLGLSEFRVDITVASANSPDQPLVAILLDGETWRERRTVADRDGLPIDVLKNLMRWPGVERVWLPEWLQQREATLDRLETAVREAEAVHRAVGEERAARSSSVAIAPSDIAVSAPSDIAADVDPSAYAPGTRWASTSASNATAVSVDTTREGPAPIPALKHPNLRTFVEWSGGPRGRLDVLDALPSPAASKQVRSLIREIVATEGPIHKMRLAKLVAGAFGLNKVHASRSEAILRCADPEFARHNDRACLWPESIEPTAWRNVRRVAPGESRAIEHVPLAELANAMALVAELSGGMYADEIKREGLALFGGKRLTTGINERLNQALAFGRESGRLEERPGGLIIAAA